MAIRFEDEKKPAKAAEGKAPLAPKAASGPPPADPQPKPRKAGSKRKAE